MVDEAPKVPLADDALKEIFLLSPLFVAPDVHPVSWDVLNEKAPDALRAPT